MRAIRLFAALTVLFPCSGCCVVSHHPLWSPEVNVEDPSVVGLWKLYEPEFQTTTTFAVSRSEEGAYEITASGHQMRKYYHGRLARIGDHIYLDIQLAEQISPDVPKSDNPHHLYRFTRSGDTVRLEPCDPKKVVAAMKKARILGEGDPIVSVITAESPRLQAFFEEHGGEILDKPLFLRRMPSIDSTPDAKPTSQLSQESRSGP